MVLTKHKKCLDCRLVFQLVQRDKQIAELLEVCKELIQCPNKKRPDRVWETARAAITKITKD